MKENLNFDDGPSHKFKYNGLKSVLEIRILDKNGSGSFWSGPDPLMS
jgi:hypothetical protein